MVASALFCALAPPGCSPSGEVSEPWPTAGAPLDNELVTPAPLVAPERWRVAGEAEDPMRALRAGATLCSDGAAHVEGGGVEVSTASCNHASLVQPSLRAVAAGDVVSVRAWWGVLDADAPARGELAVFLAGELVWQDSVAIPGRPDARDVSFVSARDYPAGVPIVFHVHNHGSNNWTMGEISVRRPD
ncbi:MAG TPA: hypothetical protein VFS00_03585 [Polyangiaceae bacterium]|nr:hypothetical protein [Polyangiaceae bacterium]